MDQFPPQTPDPDTQPASPIPATGQHPEHLAYAPPGYQPAYPSAPAPGEPEYITPYPTHKSRKGRWIVSLIVAVLLFGGIGIAAYFVVQAQHASSETQNTSTVSGTLQTFCEGYKNLDAHKVYGTLSTQMQAQLSNNESTIQSAFSTMKDMGGKVTSCTVSNIQQNGSTAIGTVTYVTAIRANANTNIETLKLTQEGGHWKINSVVSHQ